MTHRRQAKAPTRRSFGTALVGLSLGAELAGFRAAPAIAAPPPAPAPLLGDPLDRPLSSLALAEQIEARSRLVLTLRAMMEAARITFATHVHAYAFQALGVTTIMDDEGTVMTIATPSGHVGDTAMRTDGPRLTGAFPPMTGYAAMTGLGSLSMDQLAGPVRVVADDLRRLTRDLATANGIYAQHTHLMLAHPLSLNSAKLGGESMQIDVAAQGRGDHATPVDPPADGGQALSTLTGVVQPALVSLPAAQLMMREVAQQAGLVLDEVKTLARRMGSHTHGYGFADIRPMGGKVRLAMCGGRQRILFAGDGSPDGCSDPSRPVDNPLVLASDNPRRGMTSPPL